MGPAELHDLTSLSKLSMRNLAIVFADAAKMFIEVARNNPNRLMLPEDWGWFVRAFTKFVGAAKTGANVVPAMVSSPDVFTLPPLVTTQVLQPSATAAVTVTTPPTVTKPPTVPATVTTPPTVPAAMQSVSQAHELPAVGGFTLAKGFGAS
jgi:hypothetical protein